MIKFNEIKSTLDNQYDQARIKQNKDYAEKLYRDFMDIYNENSSEQLGKGLAIKHYLENTELSINANDLFVDVSCHDFSPQKICHEKIKRYALADEDTMRIISTKAMQAEADFGHTMPDWNTVFDKGIVGIINEADQKLKDTSLTSNQEEFYKSVKHAYEGILTYIKRLFTLADEANTPNADFAAKNLLAISQRAPQTLGEAMQLYFIYFTAQRDVEGANPRSLGDVDKLLYPFYRNDIEHGMSNDDIREMIKYFLYKWNTMKVTANVPFALCKEVNELTYIIIEEYVGLSIHDPKIHIKCDANTPERVLRLVVEAIRDGNNSFVFINSEIAQKALMRVGISETDAKNYAVIGCYEPAADGTELPCTTNGRICLPFAVEAVMNRGKTFISETLIGNNYVDSDSLETFEGFYSSVKHQLSHWTSLAINTINSIEKQYPKIIQAPILSATYKSCMEKGIDIYSSGAKYNNSSICIFGIGTAVDSLVAIKRIVYDEKKFTLTDFAQILKNNFANNEKLRRIIQEKYPKYGNNDEEADNIEKDLVLFMSECINNKTNGRGGVYRLGIFSIDWTIGSGKRLGATADGRLAGEPVSKNICASVGMEKNGITSLINSSVKLNHTLTPNGTVLDLAIHPSAVKGDEGISIINSTIKTYFAKGGYATHINVVSAEKLKKAMEEPDKYRNLQIRLCGWNVYFTELDKASQIDFIKNIDRGM